MQAEQANVVDSSPVPVAYVSIPRGEIVKLVALGLVVGLLVPLGTSLLTTYFIEPVFCRADGGVMGICSSGGVIANHIAAVVIAVAAFAVMTRWGIYRALLLAVASTLALWGLQKYAASLTTGYWLEYYLFSALLYGLAYMSFYWLLRLKNFVASLVLCIALVVAVCVVMVVAT
ncbi:MAG TPA: hypothetical protein VM581_04140 [Magnetospirillaceae bacterium]|nr:hypothetical protein [Magnetospirillaceae bacterium]